MDIDDFFLPGVFRPPELPSVVLRADDALRTRQVSGKPWKSQRARISQCLSPHPSSMSIQVSGGEDDLFRAGISLPNCDAYPGLARLEKLLPVFYSYSDPSAYHQFITFAC